ncbi:DUF2783 domain-containing protein [Sphingobium sp. AN641]|uniref:DUF2783 domain-containing protein n=1 Tax=Sphingobium sp. AN641 TaxID=3133443 RepID=UPI0030C61702
MFGRHGAHDGEVGDPGLDDFYAALIALYDGLDEQESAVLNAKLILILANHIGNGAVLAEALDLARRS